LAQKKPIEFKRASKDILQDSVRL